MLTMLVVFYLGGVAATASLMTFFGEDEPSLKLTLEVSALWPIAPWHYDRM